MICFPSVLNCTCAGMAMSSLSFKLVGHSMVDINTIKPRSICFNHIHSRSIRCSDGSNDNVSIQVKTSPVERFKSIACGLCAVWAVAATYPIYAATPRLPPLSNDPNRCERAFVGNTIGQANGVYDKPIDLRSCDFTNEKSNLRGKSLAAALMSDAKFDGADMSEVIMSKAYAVGASFKGVDFSNAVIDRVNFGKANMQDAVFKNTVLSGSTFDGANLEGEPPPPPPLPRSGPLAPPQPPPLHPGASGIHNLSPVPPLPPSMPSRGAPPPPPPPFGGRNIPPPPPPLRGHGVPPSPPSLGGNVPNGTPPPPPPQGRGRGFVSRGGFTSPSTPRRASLKPLHWIKVTRAVKGSLWAEAQMYDEAIKPPEFDMSELENLFSAAMPTSGHGGSGERPGGRRTTRGAKSDRVHLIDLKRAHNCEIMLTKVKMPMPDVMSAVLALDDTVLDIDQVENLIKFCPTKEEMDLLRGYNGETENLGKCEQVFLEMMKVPRVESKLTVFAFKSQFISQVSDLRKSLNIVKYASREVRESIKLRRIMQTILCLGNALNQGTARGSAIGFRLDSLLKLIDTRARNNKMTLMHYLCKVLAEKLPELLDFNKDLAHLEAASKRQLKTLAEEMQAVSKGIEKVEQELTASENDGPVSDGFRKLLKGFLVDAEADVKSLTYLYSEVGRSADALALFFGEDPARCPFEQVVSTLLNFVTMFRRAHEENIKQAELERKKAEKEAEKERMKLSPLRIDAGEQPSSPLIRKLK